MLVVMTASESERLDLYNGLSEILGSRRGDTLMTYLPAVPGYQIATKADIARLEARFDRLEEIVRAQQRFYVSAVVGSMTALTAISPL
jgi:hypothetical protein